MSIPEAAIEAAAARLSEQDWLTYSAGARAAIEAAMPAIREAIAQEIEAAPYTIPSATNPKGITSGRDQAARIVRGGAA